MSPSEPFWENLSSGGDGSSSVDGSALDDPELIRRVEDYCQSLERGESVRRDELLAEFPEAARQLAECLDALEFVNAALSPEHTHTRGTVSAALPPMVLPVDRAMGDFRLLKEIGRGGMGVVYEAEQISLQRRVALKVLPFAAVLETKQLQRFRNEALAAAGLDHPHVVRIHSVGCERGVHYYAMQHIEGQSLAQVIRDLRALREVTPAPSGSSSPGSATQALLAERPLQLIRGDCPSVAADHSAEDPSASNGRQTLSDRWMRSAGFFRTAAALALQAAEALDYAHQMGVIHRDVKPSNLMVDASGHLWVTDFGLAITRTDLGLTTTGELVGTIRYMSPEQALGQRRFLDHRTDVYSLGATLYELLTLRPMLEGEDRGELLRQLARPQPRALRRIRPEIPRDLETIVLKAIAEEPRERYASAGELAADLRRFLDGEPIHARPPAWLDVAGKWTCRHKWAVSAAVVLLLAAAVISPLVAARQYALRRQIAEERGRAQMNSMRALHAVNDLYTEVVEDRLSGQPQRLPDSRRLVEKARQFYKEFAETNAGQPEMELETVRAYNRLGSIHYWFNEYAEAESAHRTSIRLLEDLVRREPSGAHQLELAKARDSLGFLLRRVRRFGEAEAEHRKALELYDDLCSRFPDHALLMASAAHSRNNLGLLCANAGRANDAESAYRQALRVRDELVAKYPGDLNCRFSQSISQQDLGSLLLASGSLDEAEPLLRQAVASREHLLRSAPQVVLYRWFYALAKQAYVDLLIPAGRAEEAELHLAEALTVIEALVRDVPVAPDYQRTYGSLIGRYWEVLRGCGRAGEAQEVLERAVSFLDKQVKDEEAAKELRPAVAAALNSLAWQLAVGSDRNLQDGAAAVRWASRAVAWSPESGSFWNTLGAAQYRAGDLGGALESFEKSMKLQKGGDAFDWLFLAMAHYKLGHPDEAQQWYRKSRDWIDAHGPPRDDLRAIHEEARSLLEIQAGDEKAGVQR